MTTKNDTLINQRYTLGLIMAQNGCGTITCATNESYVPCPFYSKNFKLLGDCPLWKAHNNKDKITELCQRKELDLLIDAELGAYED